jgi:hypothetical protein
MILSVRLPYHTYDYYLAHERGTHAVIARIRARRRWLQFSTVLLLLGGGVWCASSLVIASAYGCGALMSFVWWYVYDPHVIRALERDALRLYTLAAECAMGLPIALYRLDAIPLYLTRYEHGSTPGTH